MSYFGELRELVGHRPLLMVGATVLIMDDQNRLLLLKRVDNDCWGPPGGVIELGEVVEEAAKREVFEETGLEIGGMSLFGIFSGREQFYCYPNGDEVYNVAIVYLNFESFGKVRLSSEHTDWRFFPIRDIPAQLSPPIVPIIRKFADEFNLGAYK